MSGHERRIWLLESAVAVRFDGAARPPPVRRRPSPLERHTATPSRRHARRIWLRHWRFVPPASTQAATSSWQYSRQMRPIDCAFAADDAATSMNPIVHTVPAIRANALRRR